MLSDVAIIGAGIAGACAAIGLRRIHSIKTVKYRFSDKRELKVVDGVQASERSPPVPPAFIQKDSVALHRPLDILTSEVRLPLLALGHRGMYPVRLRQSRHPAHDRGRGVLHLQRKAA